MQTFLTSVSFGQSAKWLDRPGRLGKQRLEGIDCLKLNLYFNYDIPREVLNFPEWLIKRYGNHPTRKMWAGYEWSLWHYCRAIIHEWRNAGYRDCCLDELMRLYPIMAELKLGQDNPVWLTEEFASNHRAVLLGKAWEAVNHLDKRIKKYQELREEVIIGTVEEMAFTKEINKSYRKYQKACDVLEWYQSLGWQEKPAERVLIDGRCVWPYIWPESEAA